MADLIKHEGTIVEINARDIFIRTEQKSACAGCHAKGACTSLDKNDRMMTLPNDGKNYQIGERILVVGKRSLGLKAVWWSFVLPFLLILFVLFLASSLNFDDSLAGIGALSALIPYYFVLFLLRNKFSKEFVFTIEKITN